jgi:hypothetical protein
MKKCKICDNEFEQKSLRGSEQLYCSDKCRQQGYLQRKAAATTTTNSMGAQNPNNIQARYNPPGEVNRTNFDYFSSNPIEQLEKTYEAKTEALKWQMKYESIAKEVDELKTKNNVLSMQLETMGDDEEPEESGNFLAGVMKNPQPVIMAVNILIDKGFEIYERVQSKKQKIAQA